MGGLSDIRAFDGKGEYIFLSYSHMDKAIVYPFIAALQEEFNVWFDEGIHYGHEWEEEIVNRLKNCSIFVFFITRNSIKSENCKDELYQARKLKKNFINILFSADMALPDWFEFRYGRFQMCNYLSFSSPESAIEDLKRKCSWFDLVKKDTGLQPMVGLSVLEKGKTADVKEEHQAREAKESEDADELFKLGCRYEVGQDTPQDYTKAAECYRKAAEQGHARAQYNLGRCYSGGCGVQQDVEKAVEWLRKAAEQGDEDAKSELEKTLKNP